MSTFNNGDVVKLKSGGPKMTIRRIEPDGEVICDWFVGQKKEAGGFRPESLTTETGTFAMPVFLAT
jgi:uncharacterized protein YodC (DUF2158 family)